MKKVILLGIVIVMCAFVGKSEEIDSTAVDTWRCGACVDGVKDCYRDSDDMWMGVPCREIPKKDE